MVDTAVHALSVPFAIVTATGAGVLALLARVAFHESPFRRTITLLVFAMSLLTVYHWLLLVVDPETLIFPVIRAAVFVVFVASVGIAIRTGRRISESSSTDRRSFKYRGALLPAFAGVSLLIAGEPLFELLVPSLLHWVHGFAALLVLSGCYRIVSTNLRRGEWTETLLSEPSSIRQPDDWMVPMDDSILELLHASDLVLTPAIIAYNIDRSREEVNRRLSTLKAHGVVEKVERGKYRTSSLGEHYLRGEPL